MKKHFTVDEDYAEAEVYRETMSKGNEVYLVKVKFTDIGTYISGIRVQKSPMRPQDGLWVQMPAAKVGMRYFKVIECANDSPFREMVERKANEAVEAYLKEKSKEFPTLPNENDDFDDFDKPIDLAEIPF